LLPAKSLLWNIISNKITRCFLRKTHVSPPRAFLCARFWRKAKNEIWPWILWSLKALGKRVLALLSGNSFYFSGHCDLDLWPTDPKINRIILLNKGYHPMKFEGSGSKGTRVIERKRSVTEYRRINWQGSYVTYRAHVTLTFDLLTQNQ